MNSNAFLRTFFVRAITGLTCVWLGCGVGAYAQAPTAVTPQPTASDAQRAAPEARTVAIRIEDAGNRIDEVRVGGETRSITVQPKGGMPSYQVAPTTGERRWNVLDF